MTAPRNLESSKFAWAEHLIVSGDRTRALNVARELRDGLVKIGLARDLAELDAWMTKHGRRPRR